MSCDQEKPYPEFLVLEQVTLNSVEIQVTGKSRAGHFNQMTITNRRVFMSWLCELASGKLLAQTQTGNTYIRTISSPKTEQAESSQQYHATQNLSQHQLLSVKGFPHKTGMGNDVPKAK